MTTQRAEAELIDQYLATRDPALREEIILRSIPLVHFVLGRLGVNSSRGSDYDDLVSQGLLGLIEAVNLYNPAYGTRLSTYATLKIRSKVLDYLRSIDWMPRTARQRVRSVQNAMVKMQEQLQRLPTEDELAEHLEMDIDIVQQAFQDSSRVVVSLDETMDTGEDQATSLYERTTDENQPDPSETFESADTNRKLVEAIQALPEKERLVLSLYYYEELTYKEIGEILSVTESRVCQIHGKAVMSLKAIMGETERKPAPEAGTPPAAPPKERRRGPRLPANSYR
ncbi:MAG TPA: FliA/WhiG family RNA polymerase sigma factor [Anaerolineaceae bacterium]|nr:FliA/WhiG family RNA polymerase sigma factor [Anaerolineaceae bacterium]HPN52820.1 FliA/WhiG family RNA polymerase sigma factor [Anaerolineaceae bacterium]